MGIFGNFFGIFSGRFFRSYFLADFLGGFLWEDFWEDVFERNFLWGIFWEDFLVYLGLSRFWFLSRFCLNKEGGQEFRSLEVRRKLITLKNIFPQTNWEVEKNWYFVTKIVLVIKKIFWNSRLKAKNLQIFWDH